jgi:hypothetical protein
MNINWTAPFKFAFELALWLTGSILVLLVIFMATAFVWAVVKTFVSVVKKENKKTEVVTPTKPWGKK